MRQALVQMYSPEEEEEEDQCATTPKKHLFCFVMILPDFKKACWE